MNWFRLFSSLWRGTLDRDAFDDYQRRLLDWARHAHGLSSREYRERYEGRYVDAAGVDLFLDYLLSASKESPSFISDHPGLLADRKALFERFGHPILTMRELRDQENERLARMKSPLRL